MNNPSSEYGTALAQDNRPRTACRYQSDDDDSILLEEDEGGRLRRRFSGTFKASVVLEALEGKFSVQELAERHQLHPNQIRNWKSLFRKRLPYLFEDRRLYNTGRRNPLSTNVDTIPGEG